MIDIVFDISRNIKELFGKLWERIIKSSKPYSVLKKQVTELKITEDLTHKDGIYWNEKKEGFCAVCLLKHGIRAPLYQEQGYGVWSCAADSTHIVSSREDRPLRLDDGYYEFL